ncbi:hypothetical protein GCM10008927_27260 [Amylibacter ulvae]|uniref:Methyltransferase n=1 Tax=Paramylibacter ulvae TaxID=1651968 RepID=A0ABQ3D6K0_9RHOB|nr:site-specific DNA-methyltransferase [Amylibacter ulvae]GHA60279.1 hypothetical protein GCM10008927_27260 [Amylibacter ulvae]
MDDPLRRKLDFKLPYPAKVASDVKGQGNINWFLLQGALIAIRLDDLKIDADEMAPILSKNEFINKILVGDAVSTMKKLPQGCVDIVVTSPPYNLKNSTGNGMKDGRGGKWSNAALMDGYANYNDNMPHDDYVAWQRKCLTEMMRVVSDDGAIFYNHKWRVQAGLLQDRSDIVEGFPVRQIIIWRRKGGFNFNPGYFVPTYEVIYLIAKKGFKLAKGGNSHGDIWEFTQEQKNPHPAPFPVALIDRIITSTNAKTVLDPFMGSGTTAISAKSHNRDYVGIELSEKYVVHAEERIKNYFDEADEISTGQK